MDARCSTGNMRGGITNPYLEVHYIEVAAHTSHQCTPALSWKSCHFARHLGNGSNTHLSSGVLVSWISSRSQRNTRTPARAAGAQRRVPGVWGQQVRHRLTRSRSSSSLGSAPLVVVVWWDLRWGCSWLNIPLMLQGRCLPHLINLHL